MTEKETNGDAKTEDNTSEPTELESSIIRQIEYYFGDANIIRDKFLREQIKLDDGWLPCEVLIKFKRLANLSTDFDVICNALNKSTSGLLEVSAENKKVRRHPDMPIPEMNEERRKELLSRTVYAKGFPKDSILDDLLKFFHGLCSQEEVENVVMRRYVDRKTKERLFKGSVFATFKTKDLAEKILGMKDLKYGETDLLILSQEAYLQKKQEEYNERKEKKEKKKNKAENAKEETKEHNIKLPTGTVLHFTQDNENFKREDIHGALTELGAEIAFIDYKVGEKEGWVRLAKENQAKEVAEKITDGKIKVGDTEVSIRLLDGEEEKTHLEKTVEAMINRRKSQKMFTRNNRHAKGNKYYGKKRKAQGHDDAPPAKVKGDTADSTN